MIVYQVKVKVDAELCLRFEEYMTDEHIPQVLSTNRFKRASFESSGDGEYRTCYYASAQSDLDAYLNHDSGALRDDFNTRFPTGVEVSRAVWTVLKSFA